MLEILFNQIKFFCNHFILVCTVVLPVLYICLFGSRNCQGNLHFLPQYVLTEKLAELDLIRDHRINNNQAEKQELSPKLSHYCGCWRK